MGDFVLKIEAPSAKKRDTIRAAPTDYAGELLKLLLKKLSPPGDPTTYGLVRPAEGTTVNERFLGPLTVNGVWLDPSKTLQQCNVKNNDTIVLKRLPADLYIGTPDGETRLFRIDLYAVVEDIITELCTQLDLKRPEDHVLEASDVLSREVSAYAQNVRPGSKCTLRLRRSAINLARSMSSRLLGTSSRDLRTNRMSVALPSPTTYSPTSGRPRGTAVFGAPLDVAVSMPNCPYDIPVVVEQCVSYLETYHLDTEGVFRLSGSANTIQHMKDRYDRGDDVDMSSSNDPHAVTGVLKLYLREMPEPLMTYPMFNVLALYCQQSPSLDTDVKVRYYRALLQALPDVNRRTLQRLMRFLHKLAQHKDNTKMGSVNLATVIGPNIIRQENETLAQTFENSRVAGQVTDELIQFYPAVFEGPGPEGAPPMLQAVRALYEYKAKAPQELSFPADSLLFVHRSAGTEGWWEGEYLSTFGLIPNNVIEPLLTLKPPPPPLAPAPASRRASDRVMTPTTQQSSSPNSPLRSLSPTPSSSSLLHHARSGSSSGNLF